MAQATTKTVEKEIIKLTMGPKEAQSLRNLLARVQKGGSGSQNANLRNIRAALASEGFHRSPDTQLSGVVTASA